MLVTDQQAILEHVTRALSDSRRIGQALEMVRGVVAFLETTYCWEGFWEDYQFGKTSMHQQNGQQLRAFLRQFEELFPELREKKTC